MNLITFGHMDNLPCQWGRMDSREWDEQEFSTHPLHPSDHKLNSESSKENIIM